MQESKSIRRVRNLCYSKEFGELGYRELLMCHASEVQSCALAILRFFDVSDCVDVSIIE